MFIRMQCERSFGTFLDTSAGDWPVDVADALFVLCQDCVKDKRLRPLMAEVKLRISEIHQSVT